MFRFNSKILDLVKDQFWAGSFRNDGYAHQFGELKEASSTINEEFYPIDSLKLELFEEFVSQIKNDDIKLIVVFSPKKSAASSAAFTPVREICERNNVELWDYYSDLQFPKNAYFKDNVHLNDYGAKFFTSVIANRLMEIID